MAAAPQKQLGVQPLFGKNSVRSRSFWKFCFTLVGRLLCFEANLNRTHTVSPHYSRKSFLAKLGGLLAVVGVVPSLFAKSDATTSGATATPVTLRREQRAVAREEGSY